MGVGGGGARAGTAAHPSSPSDAAQHGPQGGQRRTQANHVIARNSAEREGFEPSEPLRAHMISNPVRAGLGMQEGLISAGFGAGGDGKMHDGPPAGALVLALAK